MGKTGVVVDETDPEMAYQTLLQDPKSVLIDVRTEAEWTHIGMPDLASLNREVICVEWVRGPDRMKNDGFLEELRNQLGDQAPSRLFFICRSGARSLAAAEAVAGVLETWFPGSVGGPVHCTNVAEGFEGNRPAGAFGSGNGWKERGLPWQMG